MLRLASRDLFLLGGLAVIFGLVATFWPVSTVVALVVMWGVYALADGIFALATAFGQGGQRAGRPMAAIVGVLGVVAGLIAIIHPMSSISTLTWLLGLWLVFRGVAQVIDAFGAHRAGSRWAAVFGGLVFIVAGIIVMNHTGLAVLTISWWIGALAILWGVALIAGGFLARNAARRTQL